MKLDGLFWVREIGRQPKTEGGKTEVLLEGDNGEVLHIRGLADDHGREVARMFQEHVVVTIEIRERIST